MRSVSEASRASDDERIILSVSEINLRGLVPLMAVIADLSSENLRQHLIQLITFA